MHNDQIESNTVDKALEEGESFADMFEKSMSYTGRLEPGQKVKARVISISGDLVYIDLGGKSEGVIALSEFNDEKGKLVVHEGDEVEAFFIGVQDGLRKLTTLVRGYSSVQLNDMQAAHAAGLPVNGEVKREVKGGFEIAVGGVRCFCPLSQIDLSRGREGGVYLGQTFPFKIIEFKEEGRNIVVSRRVLLEQEKQAKIDKLREALEVGMDITVKVSSIQKFGAFVDLGGIDGLIPVSELSWDRIDKTGDVLSAGQEVTARIISLDWDARRLTLSIKAMQPDPWSGLADKYTEGSKISGTIVRLAPFGAFVNVEPGIDGLVHISNLGAGRRINHPKEVVNVGQAVEVYVLSVDKDNRKLSLSMQPKREPEKVVYPAVGTLVSGVVEKVMPFGLFLKIEGNVTGLVPNSEMATPAGSDHSRMFPAGTEMQAVVLDVDVDRGRVSLSRKEVLAKKEQDEFKEYKDSVKNDEKPSNGLGSLGELLKAKMEEKKLLS